MELQFLGAARTTTGSMHMVTVNGKRLLLDCGLYQGKRKEAFERNRNLPFDPAQVDAILLSHAHIDHSGNIPTLVKKGFRGRIYATPPTRDLCAIMLLDTAHLQTKDVQYVNKKRSRLGKRPFEPLYEQEDVFRALERFTKVPYGVPFEVAPGTMAAFHEAGHILGSAMITLDAEEGGRRQRLFFTGDLGRRDMPIIRDPELVRDYDILITESTYGNRVHPEGEDVKARLETLCRKVLDRSSRLIIPAFAVGRTQRLLYRLQELWRERRLPDLPVYVDSPMAVKVTQVYEDHPECYDSGMKALIGRDGEPFSFGKLRFVSSVEESMALNDMQGPLVIISASGMCEGGRILHHLKHSVGDPKNIVLITGYQAEHTLGRRLVEQRSQVRIYGDEYELRAEVQSVQALSAHADRQELLDYFARTGAAPRHAFVVHGEPDQAEPLGQALRERGIEHVSVPAPGETARL